MLKYTPEHVTCMATFWGPLIKPGTGFLAVQDVSSRQVTVFLIIIYFNFSYFINNTILLCNRKDFGLLQLEL